MENTTLIIIIILALIVFFLWYNTAPSVEGMANGDGSHSFTPGRTNNGPGEQFHYAPVTDKLDGNGGYVRVPTDKMARPYTLYLFYSPNCGACNAFKSTWSELTEDFKGNNLVQLVPVNADDPANRKLSFYYNIKHVPTLIMKDNKGFTTYDGPRDRQSLINYIKNTTMYNQREFRYGLNSAPA